MPRFGFVVQLVLMCVLALGAFASATTLHAGSTFTERDTINPSIACCDAAPLPSALNQETPGVTTLDRLTSRGNFTLHINPRPLHHAAPAWFLLTGLLKPSFLPPAIRLLYCTWLH